MDGTLKPELRRAIAERVRYYGDLGIYDFYRRDRRLPTGIADASQLISASSLVPVEPTSSDDGLREDMGSRKSSVMPAVADESLVEVISPKAEDGVADHSAALELIREDLGDCTRCKLHQEGRMQIVFGLGNPRAELLFVC